MGEAVRRVACLGRAAGRRLDRYGRPLTDDLPRRMLAEFLGSAMLVAVVVGSGIAAARLSPADVGLQLLENAIATAAGLVAILLAFGPVSGAHLNPAVSVADWLLGGLTPRALAAYVVAQVSGCIVGCVLGNLMFSEPAVALSDKARTGGGLWLAEGVATFGLLVLVVGLARTGRLSVAPFAVGAYIGSAYFFTASTSFANPAVTVGRMFTDTFAGIAPSSVPGFVLAQAMGVVVALAAVRVLYPGNTVALAQAPEDMEER